MVYETPKDLPSADARAIIINVGTKWVTTLALLSALRYLDIPIAVLDCHSGDGSLAHFQRLMREQRFDLVSIPLNNHGATLDALFRQIPARSLLLIDSDLELRSARTPGWMLEAAGSGQVFGAGFLHRGQWMTEHNQPYGWYAERMWIPLTLLNTRHVREALEAGESFRNQTVINEFLPSERLGRLLIKRFRIPGLRQLRLAALDRFRAEYFGHRPAFVTYDTGARLFQHLRDLRGYQFAEPPWPLSDDEAAHFHGVTRLLLNRRDRNGAALTDISATVMRRLRDEYGVAAPPAAEEERS